MSSLGESFRGDVRLGDEKSSGLLGGMLALSLLLHGAFYGAMPRNWSTDHVPLMIQEVEITVDTPPPPPPEPEVIPEPEPEPIEVAPKATPTPVAKVERVAPETPPPAAEPPPPAQEAPVRFDGVTLTNDTGGWAAAEGSGERADGPRANPGKVTGRSREGVPGGVPGGTGALTAEPPVVPLASLARKPGAPDLQGTLTRYYPPKAKDRGIDGSVTVRARINPDGTVSSIAVQNESPAGAGFAEACQKALRPSKWKPGLTADGKPAATVITYVCDFRIRD